MIPNVKIASRWNGALQARLRHAPLEAFLRSQRQKWSLNAETGIADNLTCATIHVVGRALAEDDGRLGSIAPSQCAAVAQIACTVAAALALLIHEPTYWRTAALVGTARILEPTMGLSAAALAAAAAAREFNMATSTASQQSDLLQIGHAVHGAVASNDPADMAAALRLIASRLVEAGRNAPAGTGRVAFLFRGGRSDASQRGGV